MNTNISPYELDCKTVGFFLKISKEICKGCCNSLTRAKRSNLTRPYGVWGEGNIFSVSPQVSLSGFPNLLFDCSGVAYLNTQKYGLFCSLPMNNQHKRPVT